MPQLNTPAAATQSYLARGLSADPIRAVSRTTLGQATRSYLARGLSAFGVVLLAAVPALGLTVLSPGLFSSQQAGEEASTLAPAVAVSWNPLTFDAPTTTLEQMKALQLGSPLPVKWRAPSR